MWKKCTPLWREAHFEVKMLKALGVSDHFWRFRCRFASLHYTTLHYTTLHYTALHYTTLHYTTLQLQLRNYTPLHSTIHSTTLNHIHYTKSHYTTLHYTRLHYTTLAATWTTSARLLRVCALLSGLGSAQKRTVQLWCVLVVLALTCHRRFGLCLAEPEMLCNISLMAMEQAAEQQLEDGNRNKATRKLMASICNR